MQRDATLHGSFLFDRISWLTRNLEAKAGLQRLAVLILSVLALAIPASPQAVSLLAGDTIDDITILSNGKPQSVTVMRDAYNSDQWYYVPTRPRLVEVTANGQLSPIFHLYRYQFNDPEHPDQLLEGGLLQFSATLSLDPPALAELRAKVLAAKSDINPLNFSISALRMTKATAQLYSPGANGLFVRTAPDGNGDAPIFTTQDMAFAVDLTKIGATLYDSLLKGDAGLKLQVDYTYGGLTPPAGFTVTVDYKQALDYYGKNSVFSAQASYYGLWGASYKNESTEIRQKLENSGALTIDVIEGSNFKKDDIDAYLQPIIKRINDEILQTVAPPDQIEAPRADPSSKGGYFGSANYSVATKDIHQLKQLKETINMRVRMYEERKTSAATTISVGFYPKEIRDKLFSVVPALNWDSTFYRLPVVDLAANSGVTKVDLTTSLQSGDVHTPQESFTWTSSTGTWMDNQTGRVSTGKVFPLLAAGFSGDALTRATFTTTYGFTSRGKNQQYSIIDKAFSGSRPLTTPTQGIDTLVIDASNLTFKDMEDAGKQPGEIRHKLKLLKVTAVIDSSQDRPIAPIEITSTKANGAVVAASPASVLLVNPSFVQIASPVSLKITFYLSDGSRVAWTGNTKDLRRDYPDMDVTLVDKFWDTTVN